MTLPGRCASVAFLDRGERAMRVAVAMVAAVVVLLGSGCTPDPGPQPTPTPVTPTPTENAQEREQRLAYEAAEKSYREYRAEYQRVLSAGGSSEPTKRMRETAGGPYLKETAEVAKAYKGLTYHSVGSDKIVYVHRAGYSNTSVVLNTCEDSAGVRILDKKNRLKGRGEVRTLELEVRISGSRWKVWSGRGKKVGSCEA